MMGEAIGLLGAWIFEPVIEPVIGPAWIVLGLVVALIWLWQSVRGRGGLSGGVRGGGGRSGGGGGGGGRVWVMLLRLIGMLALAWILLGPRVIQTKPYGLWDLPPRLWVVVDGTASMQTQDVASGVGEDVVDADRAVWQSRWQTIWQTWLTPEHRQTLDQFGEVSIGVLDGRRMRWLSREKLGQADWAEYVEQFNAQADESPLVDELEQLLPQLATSGDAVGDQLWVLSDGHDTTLLARPFAEGWPGLGLEANQQEAQADISSSTSRGGGERGGEADAGWAQEAGDAKVESLVSLAQANQVKVHTLALGGMTLSPNVTLTADVSAGSVGVDETVQIWVRVLSQADLSGQQVWVTVRDEQGQVIDQQPIMMQSDGRGVLMITLGEAITAEPGQRLLKVTAEGLVDGVMEGVVEGEVQQTGVQTGAQPTAQTSKPHVIPFGSDVDQSTQDNHQWLAVTVEKQPAGVLLVEGQPGWQTRFVADVLRDDRRLAVTRVTQVGVSRRLVSHPDPSNPPVPDPTDLLDTADGWAAYQVVVLGSQLQRVLDEQSARALVQAVDERGVQVVLADAGQVAQMTDPVGQILRTLVPVTGGRIIKQNQPVRIGLAGHDHPVMGLWRASGLNGEDGFQTYEVQRYWGDGVLKPLAQALLVTQSGEPVWTQMPVGQGRVMACLSRELWRWQFVRPGGDAGRDQQGVLAGGDLWRQTARWLAFGEEGLGEAIRLTVTPDDVMVADGVKPFDLAAAYEAAGQVMVHLRARFLEAPLDQAKVNIFRLDESELGQPSDAGQMNWQLVSEVAMQPHGPSILSRRGFWQPEAPGFYRVQATWPADETGKANTNWADSVNETGGADFGGGGRRYVRVGQVINEERFQTQAWPTWLGVLSEQTGGIQADEADPQVFFDELLKQIEAQQIEPGFSQTDEPAWDEAILLLFMLLIFGAEWVLRRKVGLI